MHREARGVVIGHEGVERVRPDRQPDAGHRRDWVTRRRRRTEHGLGGDRPAARLDADDALALEPEPRDCGVLEQVDAALRGAAGVRPGDPVVAGRRALDVVRAAEHRVAAAPVRSSSGTSSLSPSGVA